MEVSFKARARTLDMLGRQQIAGIPTAISELFKNAHDAYAERVEVDYYRHDGRQTQHPANRGAGGRQPTSAYDHIPESIAVVFGGFRT